MPNLFNAEITIATATKAADNIISGILIPFGSKVRRDMYGEFFTPSTVVKDHWYREGMRPEGRIQLPLLYSHGRAYDGSPGATEIGAIIELTKQELGWWMKAQLDRGSEYFEYIKNLVEQGTMYLSSGAIPGMVEVSREGEITQWPIIEGSLTPVPAEPRRTNVSMVKSLFTTRGISYRDLGINLELSDKGEGDMPNEKEKKQKSTEEEGQEQGEPIKKAVDVDLNLNVNLVNDQKATKPQDDKYDDEDEEDEDKKDNPGGNTKEAGGEEHADPSTSKKESGKVEPVAIKETKEIPDGAVKTTLIQDGKEVECYSYEYDGTTEYYCYPADMYNEETKSNEDDPEKENSERTTIMDAQLQQFIIGGAEKAGFTVNEDGAKSVAGEMRTYYKSLTGNDEFTFTELKLMMQNPEFRELAKGWFKSHSENGETDDLINLFGSEKDADGEEDQKAKDADGDENPNDVGKGGKSKASPVDSFAGNTPTFQKNFKERHKLDNLSTSEKSFYAHKMNDLWLAKYRRAWPGYDGFLESLEDGSKDFLDKYHSGMHMGDEQSEAMRTPGDMPIAVKAMYAIGEAKNSPRGFHAGIKDRSVASGALSPGPTSTAGDINYSTAAGFGDEWVPDLWQSELWGLMQSEAVVAGLIAVTAMPSNPYKIPLEGEDPDIYSVPETDDESEFTNTGPVPVARIPTHNTLIYAHKLGIRNALSHEYEEDAIIDVIPNMLRKQRRAFYNGIDDVILNCAPRIASNTTQRSHYGAQMGGKHKYNLGIEKGIVNQMFDDYDPLKGSNGAAGDLAINAGGGMPKLEMWRKAQSMLHELYMNEESDLVWIVTPKTRHVIKSTDKFLDAEIHSGRITGRFGDVEGIPIVVSHQLKDRDSLGRIHVTLGDGSPANVEGRLDKTHGSMPDTSSNNRGMALLLYRPYWTLGYRRRMQTWSLYDPVYDAYQAGAWIRLGMIRRDGQKGNGDTVQDKPIRATSVGIYNIRI